MRRTYTRFRRSWLWCLKRVGRRGASGFVVRCEVREIKCEVRGASALFTYRDRPDAADVYGGSGGRGYMGSSAWGGAGRAIDAGAARTRRSLRAVRRAIVH